MDLTGDNFVKIILQSILGNSDELIIINKKELKKGVVSAGSNYTSEIAQLNVEYTTNGKMESQNFILKIFSSVAPYQFWESMGIYEKEIEMYKTVLPAMGKLLNKQDDLFFPKVFQSIYPDVLVLEDLRSSGYVMIDRAKQLDFEHAAVAIKTLAKFHALSVRLNEKSPEIFNNVKADIYFNTEAGNKTFSELYESGFDLLAVQLRKIQETSSYVDSFVKLKSQILHHVKGLLLSPKSKKFQVLNHADYRQNNMMFKHDDVRNVVDIKLLDFQICRWCSPAIDIWLFVVTSIPFPIFKLHFDSLIAIYYTSLNKTLGNIGSDTRYTFKEIEKEIENTMTFGIYVMTAFLPGLLASSNPVTMDEIVNDKGDITGNFMERIHGDNNIMKVLAKWFTYFNEKIKDHNIIVE